PLPCEAKVQDAVREVLLLVFRERGTAAPAPSPVRWKLAQQECRASEVPQPSDQGEHVLPRFVELREDFQRVEGIEDEEAVIEGTADSLGVQLEQVHPRLFRGSRKLLPQHGEV